MAEVDGFAQAVEQYHRAVGEFVKGNPEPQERLWSHRDDVSLLNPIVPIAHGWQQVAQGLESAASQVRDGEVTSVENKVTYVTPELGFIVDFERTRARLGGRQDIASFELRVTTIFRREDGEWKVVHRHADPITTPQSIETVVRG